MAETRGASWDGLEQNRPNTVMQTLNLARIVLEETVSPDRAGPLAAIPGHQSTGGFLGAEIGLQSFGFGPDTENKDSVNQMSRDAGLRLFQPTLLTVEIYQ